MICYDMEHIPYVSVACEALRKAHRHTSDMLELYEKKALDVEDVEIPDPDLYMNAALRMEILQDYLNEALENLDEFLFTAKTALERLHENFDDDLEGEDEP